MNLGHDVLVIVIPQCSAQFVIVHIGLVFPFPPTPCHFIGVHHFEFTICAFPLDAIHISTVREELKQELPKLYLPTSCEKTKTKGNNEELSVLVDCMQGSYYQVRS